MGAVDAAQQIVDAARWIDARGLAPATSGNLSLRLDDRRIAITASGRHKGRLKSEDVLTVDYDGRPLQGGVPSAETLLHTSMYRLDASLGAVLHVHSVHSTVLGMVLAGQSELVLQGYELLKAFHGVSTHEARVALPMFENSQDMPALVRLVVERWKVGRFVGYLIRGHGLYTWGSTMEEALRALDALEFLMACELETRRVRREYEKEKMSS